MSQYLLDTNQLSAAVFSPNSAVRDAIATRIKSGHRVGTSVLALCELQPAIVSRPRAAHYLHILHHLMGRIRVWPVESAIAVRYGDLFLDLRQSGRALSFVDVMLAATCLDHGYVLVTSDRDFDAVASLHTEDWNVSAQPT